jgi:hypothetical protein
MKSRRSLIITAVVVVVIVLVAVASYFMSSTTKQDPSAAPPSAPKPTQTSEYGFPVSPLRLNEGGTGTAPDGRTHIGYTHSCDDAVRAAVNYIAADSYAAEGWTGREKTLKHILTSTEYAAKYIDAFRSGALEEGIVSKTSLFEPQIFNLVSCESGKSASVAVAQRIQTNSYKIGEKTIPASTEIRMADQHLVWENGDWKLDAGANYTRPETQLLYLEDKKEPASASEVLGELFTDSEGNPLTRDGWMELSR